jgi:hypothetical protein
MLQLLVLSGIKYKGNKMKNSTSHQSDFAEPRRTGSCTNIEKTVERVFFEIKKGEDSGISTISHKDFWAKHGL